MDRKRRQREIEVVIDEGEEGGNLVGKVRRS